MYDNICFRHEDNEEVFYWDTQTLQIAMMEANLPSLLFAIFSKKTFF